MRVFIIVLSVVFASSSSWAAMVSIAPTSNGSKAGGGAMLIEENGGLRVQAAFENLTPGKHGFHIHENGSCEDEGKAAGGHFNPGNTMHGDMARNGMAGQAHPGDMGNIEVGADGRGVVQVFLPGVTLKDGQFSVLGKAVIVHEKEDDFSQPTGNAGGRIACGIIQEQGGRP